MNQQVKQQLLEDLSGDLDRIARRFKTPMMTLVVRNPNVEDGDVVIGNDDLNLAIEAIKKLKDRLETVVNPEVARDGE